MIKKYLFVMVLLVALPAYSYALPAFPGAQGAGTETIGGRGGTVYIVDTTSDNAADGLTFREAVTANGPRIVVFAVSGIIGLNSPLTISNPNITIAGQTSPGGIAVVGEDVRINTSDVIIRHMRFLHASGNGTGDTLFIGNGSNIVIDHCSIKWGIDETLQIGSYFGDISDVTISNSIIAEGRDPENHALGLNISYKYARNEMPNNITLHHNYMAHFRYRMPQLAGPVGPVDITNNIFYNWESRQSPHYNPAGYSAYGSGNWSGGDIGTGAFVNFTHNYSKPGPNSNAAIPERGSAEMYMELSGETPERRVYFTGNIGTTTLTSDDAWRVSYSSNTDFVTDAWRKSTPHPMRGIPVNSTIMTQNYATEILATVGATKPVRDNTDAAVIADFAKGTGTWPETVDCTDESGSECPIFSTANDFPTDTDKDGMPDTWETANGTNPKAADDNLHTRHTGYTNIEVYINELATSGSAKTIEPPVIKQIETTY